MLVIELRDRLIEEGIVSVKKNETRPERVRGGIAGFELCRELSSPQEFERTLQDRHLEERRIITEQTNGTSTLTNSDYWEYRMATVQVEFVWERLKVAWCIGGSYSARAALHVNEILKGGK